MEKNGNFFQNIINQEKEKKINSRIYKKWFINNKNMMTINDK